MASQGLNKVILIGNLGADPELKYSQGGAAILRLRLATTERFANKNGERQERTEWHTVSMFGARAEGLAKHLSKGQTIYIEGRLQTRSWEDKDGNKRYSTEVVANDLLFLGGGRNGGEEQRGSSRTSAGNRVQSTSKELPDADDFPAPDFGEDDLPF